MQLAFEHNDTGYALLGYWYATPLTPEQASALLHQATERRQRALRRGGRCRLCRLLEMVAEFWLGEPVEEQYAALRHTFRGSAHGRALVELVYGQLLASRRLPGAHRHLAEGFRIAKPLLSAGDYFVVMKRHKLLQRLPLAAHPSPPVGLHELLNTAAVIDRLQQSVPTRLHYEFDPNDTYG